MYIYLDIFCSVCKFVVIFVQVYWAFFLCKSFSFLQRVLFSINDGGLFHFFLYISFSTSSVSHFILPDDRTSRAKIKEDRVEKKYHFFAAFFLIDKKLPDYEKNRYPWERIIHWHVLDQLLGHDGGVLRYIFDNSRCKFFRILPKIQPAFWPNYVRSICIAKFEIRSLK